ncbi:MAG: dehydrogenase E1 component subunit alpha/beta [Verrucomicrobia bacterium]|nr:dehydrogenase E1 component subunit alpha/beta [Verrucomicrobiota bacterium]
MTSLSHIDLNAAISWYRSMQLIRQTEEQLARCHARGLVHGACHTYVGQEAVAVGVCAGLSAADVIFSTHRGHGHALAKGMPPADLMAELFGRATGCSRGRGGSMHLFAPEIGMMGTSGIVGPCVLQAAGAGYTFKLLRQPHVAVAFFGDGAVNNGAFHEGVNMASIWKLPVLFVCENNQFATEVPFEYAAGNPEVASRGAAYGIPGLSIDGNDPQAVALAAAAAVKRARAGEGPTLLECKTYRTRPHSEGMGDYTYRTREEVAAWRERCPIQRLRHAILAAHPSEAAALDEIDRVVRSEVLAASEQAEKAPWPETDSAATHVYAVESSPSSAATGESRAPTGEGKESTFAGATLLALRHEMSVNPRIFVMGEGIGKRGGNFGTTTGLYEEFGPERLCDTPICERGFVGLACGAAMTGARPIVDFMFIDFINDAFGELVNQIAKMQYMSSGRLRMPVLLRGCIGIGHSAATHHSGSYHSLYSHIPGLRVVVPSTPSDAKGLFTRALRCDDPVLFLEHRELLGAKERVPEGAYEIPFGKARVQREGRDITVVALALMAQRCLKAAEALAADGISVEVVDPRTVSPLDTEAILRSVAKTGRLLIVDEAFGQFGLGAEVAAAVADAGFDDLDAPIRRLHGAFAPTPYSPTLERGMTPQVENIVQAIRNLAAE